MHMIFTTENATVYELVTALFKAQHSDVISELESIMDEYGAVFRLADMKMCQVKLEILALDSASTSDQSPSPLKQLPLQL